MCIGLPMQIVDAGDCVALCRSRNGEEQVNTLLIGPQPNGTWILSHLGWAREVISEQRAREIDMALDGLSEIMAGAESIDVDHYFPGIAAERGTGR